MEAFLSLPDSVYRGDPHHSAEARESVLSKLNREAFRRSQEIFLAFEDGVPAARVAARLSPSLRDARGRPYGMLGFFEALDRPEAVQRLFKESAAWLRGAGAGDILGPMEGDTWHKYRLNLGPYDDPPFLMEPYNPAYYIDLWKRGGFEPIESYSSKRVDDIPAALQSLKAGRERFLARGYSLRPLRSGELRMEMALIYRLSVESFAGNFLYSEIAQDEFLSLYQGIDALLDPELVWFAQAPDGTPVGFLFAYPDLFRSVAAMRGKRGPWASLKFLLNKGRVDAVNLKTLGVAPAHRRAGVASALMHEGYRSAAAKGFKRVNLCLFRDGNPSGSMDGAQGSILRRYALFRLSGEAA